jgi:hypothetical protein
MCKIRECGAQATSYTYFCSGHTEAWVASPERAAADMSDEASYQDAVSAFSFRTHAEELVTEDDIE